MWWERNMCRLLGLGQASFAVPGLQTYEHSLCINNYPLNKYPLYLCQCIFLFCIIIVVQSLSHVQLFATPWSHIRLPCPSLSPRVCSDSFPLSWWSHPTISSSATLLSCLQFSQHEGLFQWVSSSHQVAKVLELQHQFFQWIFRVEFL